MSTELLSPLGRDSLDIDKIRESFKNYLLQQGVIKDVNYLGSNISILIDIIAYAIKNLNATHAKIATESMLPTSTIRQNIIHLAQQLGYNITRRISSKMHITISYDIPANSGISVTIPARTKFKCGDYIFTNPDEIVLTESTPSKDITLIEGSFIDWNVDTALHFKITDPKSYLTINYKFIENDSIKVYVKKATDSVFTEYSRVDNILSLNNDKNNYFEEYDPVTGWIKVYFYFGGNGYELNNGDEVKISFVVSNGSAANGISSCTIVDKIYDSTGSEVVPTIVVNSASYSGQDEESNESIKSNAPLFYNSGNRAVTEYDYKAILEQSSLILTSTSWGGELMIPEKLGHIYVSGIPQDVLKEYLTNLEAVELLDKLNEVRVISTFRHFFQPVYFLANFKIKLLGNVKNPIEKQNLINTQLQNYFDTKLFGFNSSVYQTKIGKIIDDVLIEDDISATIDMIIKLKLNPVHFTDNLNDNNEAVFFIPNSSKRYYLKKGTDRINYPEDDKDVYTYYQNGWVRVYEADEDLDISFSWDNGESKIETGTKYTDTINNIDKKDLIYYKGYHATNEQIATGDSVTTTFNYTLVNVPVKPGTLTISYFISATKYTVTDDGNGNISDTNVTGTIDYNTGAISLTFTTAPDNISPITADDYIYYVISTIGYFDVTNSILFINNTFGSEINNGIKLDVSYSPYFNVELKHNSLIRLGDITYV